MPDTAQPLRGPGSAAVRARLLAAGATFRANDNIAPHVSALDLEAMRGEVEFHLSRVFDALVIDRTTDHNTADTPRRLAKLWCDEVFSGRYTPPPAATDFPNAARLGSVYVVGPVAIRSTCSHHFAPILGHAWLGVVPGARVIGLSKFHRIADWIGSRPQIQEEQTVQLADHLWQVMQPQGLAVLVRARHLCCGWRGVRDPSSEMTTTEFRGSLALPAARAEFLALVGQQPGAAA